MAPDEFLHSAVWQVLDDMRDHLCVCPAAKQQLIEAYLLKYGDEGEDAPSALQLIPKS